MPRFGLIWIVIAALLAACGTGDEEGTPSPTASPTGQGQGDAITVTGVDYAFEGLPEEVAAGSTLQFRNEGEEPHEMILLRKNEGVTESFEELLALPEEEAMEQVTQVGAVFALPGEEAADQLTVDEPGDYLAICFVPVGTSADDVGGEPPASGEHGPPHFVEGMLAEFTVTE